MRVDLTYNAAGMLETIQRYANVGGSSGRGLSTYTYDDAGRLQNLRHTDLNGSNLANYTYTYDAASRIQTEVTDGSTKTYTYDDANQLTADGTSTYTFDGTGNRNNGSYTTGTGNRISGDGTWTYTIDAEGNETKKSKGLYQETWYYSYDHKNHLTRAEKRSADDGQPSALLMAADYSYDWWGNRTEKVVDSDGNGAGGSLTTRFALDGWASRLDPLGRGMSFVGTEGWDVWADLDGSNTLSARYLRGELIDQVFAEVESETSWLVADRQGSTRKVLDKDGALKNTIAYESWGAVSSESDTAWSTRYKYTGRELDTETDLQYSRARYYDARLSRWTSEDPKGFDAGDSNLYRYVQNKPTLESDPSGLSYAVYRYNSSSSVDDSTLRKTTTQVKSIYYQADPWIGRAGEPVYVGDLDEGGHWVTRRGVTVSHAAVKAAIEWPLGGMPDWNDWFRARGRQQEAAQEALRQSSALRAPERVPADAIAQARRDGEMTRPGGLPKDAHEIKLERIRAEVEQGRRYAAEGKDANGIPIDYIVKTLDPREDAAKRQEYIAHQLRQIADGRHVVFPEKGFGHEMVGPDGLFYQAFPSTPVSAGGRIGNPASSRGRNRNNITGRYGNEAHFGQAGRVVPNEINFGRSGRVVPDEINAGRAGRVVPNERNFGQAGRSVPNEINFGQAGRVVPNEQLIQRASPQYIQQTREAFERTGGVRSQFWQHEVLINGSNYPRLSDRTLMQRGNAPWGTDGRPMVLHHQLPIEWGGTNDFSNLRIMRYSDHNLKPHFGPLHSPPFDIIWNWR